MAKIVISEFMDEQAVQALKALFDVVYDKDLVNQPQRLLTLTADCDALVVRNKTQVRGDLLAKAAKLRVVGRLGVGLDNIDVQACADRSIRVIPATGANSVSVAEYALAGLLMLARGCYQRCGEVAAGQWPRESMLGGEIYGKTLGLLGFGSIAREVAARAKPFGMNVIAHDPFIAEDASVWKDCGVTPVTLDDLLSRADAVSIHVPLTEDTRNLLNAQRLGRMKHGAFVLNTSRGGILDEDALAAALKAGNLGGAMLDVFAKEPLAAGSALADAPNCLLTPHIAGVTRESNTRVSAMIAEKVTAALKEGE
ncbi:MAG: hydroxyacid dehydrogenase [Desulfovibrio sp.]|nr:hydroxyacid dehydrogenase [Desulfovibrio sp.]